MGNSLMIYLNKRLKEEASEKGNSMKAGPVITISREVGCDGLKLANELSENLNLRNPGNNWKVLSKEIFYESAKELNLDPEKVRMTFKKSDKYTFEQILKAFGDRNYKSEQKIANTVIEVIRSFAIDGNCIIVGRAGHIITQGIPNTIRLRLNAPLDYRINTIQKNNGLDYAAAMSFIRKVENERVAFRKVINQENLQEELFDLTLNRASFSNEELIDIISTVSEKKGVLEITNKKMEYI